MGKTQNGRKGKKGNFKPQGKKGSDTFFKDGDCEQGLNDIVWWSQNPQLLKDAANLSYANVQGVDLSFNIDENTGNYVIKDEAIPGIMKIGYIPTMGISKDGSSPVNNAMRLLYSYVRHANSGHSNYEQADLMTYVGATANLIAYHAELTRLYGLAQVYSKTNRYIGKALIDSMGYDFEDVIENLASLRYFLNAAAVQINSFATPKDIYLYARYISLNSNVLTDSTVSKAQLYLFQPKYIYKWSNVDANGTAGSSLKPEPIPGHNTSGGAKVSDVIAFLQGLISALAIYEDVGIMSGDILKAFGDGGLYHIAAIPESYVVVPKYDEVMLSQIHNCTVLGHASGDAITKTYWVTQKDNNIIFNPEIVDPYSVTDTDILHMNQILDSGMEVPTPEYTMEATRLKAYPIKEGNKWYIETCGTEIVCEIIMYAMRKGILHSYYLSRFTVQNFVGDIVAPAIMLTNFDWAPILTVFDTSNEVDLIVRPFGDLNNYTTVDNSFLAKVNQAALLSALNVYSLRSAK